MNYTASDVPVKPGPSVRPTNYEYRIYAAALIKFFTPQMQRLFEGSGRYQFEGGVYLKVGPDEELFYLRYYFSVLN